MTSQTVIERSNTSPRSLSAGRIRSLLMATDGSMGPLLARIALAAVMFPHGAQKMLGWFGGYGFTGTVQFFESMGLPWLIGASVVVLEFFAPILLLLGLATRPAALALIGIMLGAIFSVHAEHGFFMNWYGNQAGEGFEYHVLVIGLGLALVASGSGRWGLDRSLFRPQD